MMANGTFMRRAAMLALAGLLLSAGGALAAEPDLIFKKSTVWKFLTPDDKLAVYGIDDPLEILGANGTNPELRTQTARKLPPTERKALEILEARDHWTKAEIRKQYKSLVKDLHPDMNGGDRSDEDRLQEVVWAWDQIKDSRSFKE